MGTVLFIVALIGLIAYWKWNSIQRSYNRTKREPVTLESLTAAIMDTAHSDKFVTKQFHDLLSAHPEHFSEIEGLIFTHRHFLFGELQTLQPLPSK